MVKIKSAIFSLCVLSSFQFFAMEIETYKKPEDHGSLQYSIFFAKKILEYNEMPKEIADIIVWTSYLLRVDEIEKKFDPFFHFKNDSYHKMTSDHIKNKQLFLKENPDFYGGGEGVKNFHDLYPYDIKLCRKFDVIEPHHLLLLNKKHDAILLSLLRSPKCFHNDKGYFSLQLTKKENKKYLKLLPELIDLLSKYPKFVFSASSYKGMPLSDENLDFDMSF